jgi:hypothetical protein
MSTFTFKRGKLGGRLERVGRPYAQVDIKLDGKTVGTIVPPTWQTKDHKWGLRFQVASTPSADNPAPWRWFAVKDRFDNETAARAFVLAKAAALIKLNLYSNED